MVSRVCQEFPCLDAYEALDRIENDPLSLYSRILFLRAYANAKSEWDSAQGEGEANEKRREKLQFNSMVGRVIEIEFALMKERVAKRKARSKKPKKA